jgi:hypothetical protein
VYYLSVTEYLFSPTWVSCGTYGVAEKSKGVWWVNLKERDRLERITTEIELVGFGWINLAQDRDR